MSARVGLLGGTFDPVHRAHVELAERARRHLDLDRVLFVLAPISLHKLDSPPAAIRHRLAMLRRALDGQAGMEVSTVEIDHGQARPSVETVAEVMAADPDATYWFLLGEDALAGLRDWVRPDELVAMVRFAVFAREGRLTEAPVAGARLDWIPGPRLDVSSREIRARLADGRATGDLHPAVRAYIDEHRLYRREGGG